MMLVKYIERLFRSSVSCSSRPVTFLSRERKVAKRRHPCHRPFGFACASWSQPDVLKLASLRSASAGSDSRRVLIGRNHEARPCDKGELQSRIAAHPILHLPSIHCSAPLRTLSIIDYRRPLSAVFTTTYLFDDDRGKIVNFALKANVDCGLQHFRAEGGFAAGHQG